MQRVSIQGKDADYCQIASYEGQMTCVSLFQKASELNPKDATTLYTLGVWYVCLWLLPLPLPLHDNTSFTTNSWFCFPYPPSPLHPSCMTRRHSPPTLGSACLTPPPPPPATPPPPLSSLHDNTSFTTNPWFCLPYPTPLPPCHPPPSTPTFPPCMTTRHSPPSLGSASLTPPLPIPHPPPPLPLHDNSSFTTIP